MSEPPSHDARLLVAILCAQWCGTCRDYRATFDAVRRELGDGTSFVWVDIEDHDSALGAVDVEDFPTLLLAQADRVLFFGPITPQAQTLTRLVQSALDGDLKTVTDSALFGLPERIRTLRT